MSLLTEVAQRAARDLWEGGMAMFPISRQLVDVNHIFLCRFIDNRLERQDVSSWNFHLPGEQEADTGLVCLDGTGGRDNKWFFHTNTYLQTQLAQLTAVASHSDRQFLRFNRELYNYACSIGEAIMVALDDLYKLDISDKYRLTCRYASPYNTTTLRSLFYQDLPFQLGACAHVDKSLISIHFGDIGGQLLRLSERADDQGVIVSPPPGFAIAFWGVKAIEVTSGRILPMWHRSITAPGTDRFAQVHFCHVETEYVVTSANEALRHYVQKYDVLC